MKEASTVTNLPQRVNNLVVNKKLFRTARPNYRLLEV
jgi:hypothetical protein